MSKHSLSPSFEPIFITQAIQTPEWGEAMANEFNALVANDIWNLVPHKSSQNVVGNK